MMGSYPGTFSSSNTSHDVHAVNSLSPPVSQWLTTLFLRRHKIVLSWIIKKEGIKVAR